MDSPITAVAIAISVVTGLVLWLLKRLYGTKAERQKLIKLQEEVDALTKKMSSRNWGYKHYVELNDKRRLLNRKIRRLQTSVSK